MDSENNGTHLRDASFSCYLNTPEENFICKLAESVQNSPPDITSTQETCPISLGRNKAKEGEISVFGAEKYFNEIMDYENPRITEDTARKHWHKNEDRVDLHRTKPKMKLGTPSVSSEASWNSQTALLPSLLRNLSQKRQNKVNGKRFFTGFACNGSCYSDKKSVYIDQNLESGSVHGKGIRKEAIQIDLNPVSLDRTKQSQPGVQVIKDDILSQSFGKLSVGLNREEHLAFPILNSGLESLAVKRQLEKMKAEEDARKSLEVFGSHMMKKGDIAMNLERKLSMLTWDAIPKAQNLPATSRSGGSGGMCDDIESDASSDLFEIDNLSSNGHPFFTRQASDSLSSCMTPTSRYEPSEASIEWSVVTASAADFSAVSDIDEKKPAENIENPGGIILKTAGSQTIKTKTIMGKEAQRSRPSGLLGCRNHKAVRVVGSAYRTNEKAKSDPQWRQRTDSSVLLGKSQAETKVKDFEFPQAQRAFAS